MDCSSCRSPLPDGARFCPGCGAPCAEATAPATGRKVVTVLFCDLVGSTALSGALDPETLRSVMLRYFDLMRHQIELHGGTVEKFIGDAVMAVFGVPTVHEDDARRALAAALEMLDGLGSLNAELDSALGVRLDVRIGVNTGAVVTGTDASVRQALVSGETVNVAARLEQNAAAGQILIGPETLRAAGGTVRVAEVGPLRLKGKADAVTAYRLLGLAGDEPELSRRFDLPFVGREAELARLQEEFEQVAGSAGARRLLVSGEAGLGKTRLAREWLDRVSPRLAARGTGRCRPYGEQGSLRPLAEALGPVLASAAAAPPELAVLSRGLLLDGTPNPSVDDTCAALVGTLAALSRSGPVVLVLDDCQWAAPLLLDVLERTVAGLADAPVLVMLLARHELLDEHPAPAVPTLTLGGLDDRDALRLAVQLTEVAAHWDEVPRRLLDRAGGNPLHLEQLLATVGEEAGDGAGRADASGADASGELPPTLQALLGARIDALAPPERLAVDLACVLGREFDPDQLVTLAGDGPGAAQLPQALRRLVRGRLMEADDGAFRFSSGLAREVAYQCLSKQTRAERHERAAELPCVRDLGDGAVGSHLERAYGYRVELGLGDRTTDRLRRRAAAALGAAGARAQARADLAWAADLLRRAQELHTPDEADAAATARRLGEVLLALGRSGEGQQLLRGVLATGAAPVETAHARLALAVATGGEAAADAARETLPVFEAAGDHLGQARACLRLAQRRQVDGRHGEADELLTRALRHAVRADGEPERAAALGAIGVSLWRGPEPAEPAIARCLDLLREHSEGRRAVDVTLNCPLAVLLALNGEHETARDRLGKAERLAEQLGFAEAQVFLPVFAATVAGLADRRSEALDLLDAASTAARRLGADGLLATAATDSARLLLDGGEWAAAQAALAPVADRPELPSAEAADVDGMYARIAAHQGEATLADRLAARAVTAADHTDSPIVRALAALDRAHTELLLGRPRPASEAALLARERFAAKGHRPGVRRAEALLIRTAAPGSTAAPGCATAYDGEAPHDGEDRVR